VNKLPAVFAGVDPDTLRRFERSNDATLPEPQRLAAESAKLGPRAAERRAAADKFLRETLYPSEYAASRDACTTASAVLHVEKQMTEITMKRFYPNAPKPGNW
jgi:hypothetical protein